MKNELIEQQLDTLPEEIIRTFHKDFIFLISPGLVQHFPARGWSQEQIEKEVKKRIGEPLIIEPWRTHTIAYKKDSTLVALIP
ncbi:hypothetical protein BAU15_09715 [Enterococcus sp. JM4C]|uniref:hypothetical protein n=1 Tax=Candidatus Enterococcus huntleyi TaxID=1857217 RepID=UPI00137B8F1C|nr:hypothetical protein [Enterococcus sp. JM4C]KAF1298115.1 hypothetical protein BAU15_09715 [Enterococcus sp. JM4C]